MKIYKLIRKDSVGYDEFEAKVIVASTCTEARQIANCHTADEGQIWEDHLKVDCKEINMFVAHVVLEAFRAG